MNPDLKRLVDLLAGNKKGVSIAEIADKLGILTIQAKGLLKTLEQDSIAYSDGNEKGGRVLWFLDSYIRDIKTSDRFQPKPRKCLGGCGQMFPSTHAGNRICMNCQAENADSEGGYVEQKNNLDGYRDRNFNETDEVDD